MTHFGPGAFASLASPVRSSQSRTSARATYAASYAVTVGRRSNARRISGSVGYRSILILSRSSTAVANRRRLTVPASQRFRKTATVSTSTRSGAASSPADRTSVLARFPSEPSSQMTLARTDASTTINDVPARQRYPSLLGPIRHVRLGDVRCYSARLPVRAWTRSASAHRQGTAGVTDPAAQPDAGVRSEHHRGYHVRARLPCLHYDSIFPRLQMSPCRPGSKLNSTRCAISPSTDMRQDRIR